MDPSASKITDMCASCKSSHLLGDIHFFSLILSIFPKIKRNRTQTSVGRATVQDPEKNPALLRVEFPEQRSSGPYQVVATDLKQYSVVYSCVQVVPNLMKTGKYS